MTAEALSDLDLPLEDVSNASIERLSLNANDK
jgi:hypothetical protein